MKFERPPEILLKSFELFLQELGLSSEGNQLANIKMLRKKSAIELYYLEDNQLELLNTLDSYDLDFFLGGLQLGWFRTGKHGKEILRDFNPALSFIDSLSQKKLPAIHLEPVMGQSFLHGQDIQINNFNRPEMDRTIFLVYSEGILIGLGKIEKTGELTNITDKGKYIRSERKRYGVKSGKKRQNG